MYYQITVLRDPPDVAYQVEAIDESVPASVFTATFRGDKAQELALEYLAWKNGSLILIGSTPDSITFGPKPKSSRGLAPGRTAS